MIQRPVVALLAICSLFACGKVSDLGHGRDSTNHENSGGATTAGGSSGAAASGGAGASPSSGGTATAGAAGDGPDDPTCVSAIRIEGDLEVSAGSSTARLVREVTGDLKIDSPTSDLPQLRCLETVGRNLDVLVETGDLSVLGHLRSVGFNLTIRGNQDVRNLSALSSLTSVGTTLTIEDNAALVDLSGLEGLDNVFELHVRNNPQLENLDALSNLTSRGGNLEIAGNHALVDLAGLRQFSKANKLSISDCPLLRDLAGLDGLTDAYDVSIVGNDALVDLSGLGAIESVNELNISDNPALPDLAGLANLAKAELLEVRNNLALENIDALGTSLRSLGSLSLDGCPKVSNVEGLSNLTSMRGVSITTSGVTTLDGLRNIEQLMYLDVRAIPIKDFSGLEKALISANINIGQASELESLRGLSRDIHALAGIVFQDNPKLRDLTGLEMLETLVLLTIDSSPQLESLKGLENLKTLQDLIITESALTSLAPLDGLQSISESADIERNPSLSQCDIQAFVQRTGAATSSLQDNGPCN